MRRDVWNEYLVSGGDDTVNSLGDLSLERFRFASTLHWGVSLEIADTLEVFPQAS